jgi:TM2 domain-containing membrane protein YozV
MQSATFKSKSFWAGLGLILSGAGMIYMGNIPEGIQTIGAGLVTIFLRDAIAKNGGGK